MTAEIAETGSPETTSRAVIQTTVSASVVTASVDLSPVSAVPGADLLVEVTR